MRAARGERRAAPVRRGPRPPHATQPRATAHLSGRNTASQRKRPATSCPLHAKASRAGAGRPQPPPHPNHLSWRACSSEGVCWWAERKRGQAGEGGRAGLHARRGTEDSPGTQVPGVRIGPLPCSHAASPCADRPAPVHAREKPKTTSPPHTPAPVRHARPRTWRRAWRTARGTPRLGHAAVRGARPTPAAPPPAPGATTRSAAGTGGPAGAGAASSPRPAAARPSAPPPSCRRPACPGPGPPARGSPSPVPAAPKGTSPKNKTAAEAVGGSGLRGVLGEVGGVVCEGPVPFSRKEGERRTRCAGVQAHSK